MGLVGHVVAYACEATARRASPGRFAGSCSLVCSPSAIDPKLEVLGLFSLRFKFEFFTALKKK